MVSKSSAMESPTERAERMICEVRDDDRQSYTKGEVAEFLSRIVAAGNTSADSLIEVARMQRGDVLIARLVGGKIRPWVTLSVKEGLVTAVAMSSGDKAPRMIQSQCRLWPGGWVGTTVSLFDEAIVRLSVSRPYTAATHLREIEGRLASLYGLRRKKA